MRHSNSIDGKCGRSTTVSRNFSIRRKDNWKAEKLAQIALGMNDTILHWAMVSKVVS